MSLFDQIYDISVDSNELDFFLEENIEVINDFANSDYNTVAESSHSLRKFILLKNEIIENLDFSKTYNKAFVSLLIEICERLGSRSSIIRLYEIYEKNDIYIGQRLNAVLLYLVNVSDNNEFEKRFSTICEKFEFSFLNEEDSKDKPVASFLNFYSYVIINTQPFIDFAVKLKKNIENVIEQNTYSFLQHISLNEALAVSFENIDEAFNTLQLIIDKLLGKKKAFEDEYYEDNILIEQGTLYCEDLKNTSFSFQNIRQLAVNKIRQIENRTEIFDSLGRGVPILKEEEQLYAYLYKFGNAHNAKILSAFEKIEFTKIIDPVEVIDWGCGQGLASLSLLEYIDNNNLSIQLKKVILIEPSELALKRAGLHLHHYKENIPLKSISKDLNSLELSDINTELNTIKIHLFSNILDIEAFSMSSLIEIVTKSQKGKNYFICVSPYITDTKADRIDRFKRYFEKNFDTFRLFASEQNTGDLADDYWNCNNNYNGNFDGYYCPHPHPNCGCDKKWTRIVRIFKVDM
uniref:hypothetical protein n=1 Tax=uncultured Draconibacterium sp. TaxID=1573823 RepID=UPI0032168AAC